MLGKPYFNVEMDGNPDYQRPSPERDAWNKLSYAERKPIKAEWLTHNKAFLAWARENKVKRDFATEALAKKAMNKIQKEWPERTFKITECTPIYF